MDSKQIERQIMIAKIKAKIVYLQECLQIKGYLSEDDLKDIRSHTKAALNIIEKAISMQH